MASRPQDAEAAPPLTLAQIMNIPDAILEQEVQRRVARAAAQKRAARIRQAGWIWDNVKSLLMFVPEHDRTSCDDEHLNTGNCQDCRRCTLLRLQKDGFRDTAWAMTLSFTPDPLPDEELEYARPGE